MAARGKPKLRRVCFKKSPSANRRIVFFGKIWVCRHAAFWLPIGEPNGTLTEELKTINHLSGFVLLTNLKKHILPKFSSALIPEMRMSSQTGTINRAIRWHWITLLVAHTQWP
jgi:hypothetical protein